MDSITVIYTGTDLNHISVTTGQNLNQILLSIDTAINNISPNPDYSGYNLYCVTEVDGITHPTNTQNFSEGISKILCNLITTYTLFTGTTYPTALTTITNAINAITIPALTYSPFSITNTDTLTQVFTKMFTGFTSYTAALNPSGASWSTLSITPPTTVTTAFGDLITYIASMNTTISGKQTQIGTFDNTANVLAGGATDSIFTTVGEIITYITTLPAFNNGSITYGGVSSGTNLQTAVQNVINTVSSLLTNGVVANGTGLTIASVGSTYQGKKLSIDPAYTTLYKVMLSGDAYTNANFLDDKIIGDETTIHVATVSNQLVISQLTPSGANQVKVNSSDSTGDYLGVKVQGLPDPAGLGLNIQTSIPNTNDKVQFIPNIDLSIFTPALLSYISNSPDIFSQFQQLVNQTSGDGCAAPTALTVAYATNTCTLSWTPSGSAASQNSKWRQAGTTTWFLAGFTPANPETGATATSTITTPLTNMVFDFSVDSLCTGGGISTSNVYQMIQYSAGTGFAHTTSGSSPTAVIHVSQNPLSLDTVEYRLKNSGSAVIASITSTGASPIGSFTGLSSDTYSIEYSYKTLVNGVNLASTDASQLNAWTVGATGIVIP